MMEKRLSGRALKRLLFSYNSVVVFLLLLLAGSFFIGRFTGNYTTIIVESSMWGFIAIGLSLVMISGYIDLSVGFQAASSAVVLILVINATGSIILGVAAAVAAGALFGAINGTAITVFGIDPLIATMATNYIFKGFTYYFTRNGSIYPEDALRDALRSNIARLSFFDLRFLTLTVTVIAFAFIVFAFVMRRTNFGSNLYISGDNPMAGQLAGINVKRVAFSAYVLCGICCGIAGVLLTSNQGGAVYTLGEGRNVFAISACVIGGVRMAGGKGTMLNVLLGILIMRMIATGMNLMFLPVTTVDLVSGALLIAVIIVDRYTTVKSLKY